MKTTLLAELTCLTKLVNGKVVVINVSDNTYKTYNPGKYCSPISDDFNPEKYALLETSRYNIIIDATPRIKEKYLVNKLWREQNANNKVLKYRELDKNQQPKHSYKVGDKVHLKDKEGIYTISDIIENDDIFGNDTTIRLTCGTWQYTDRPFRSFDISCIKCLAGGLNNLNRK
jgi:hypothetical protein